MSVKFSIILPTYNRAYLVNKAIDSVLSQTYNDWELIIVDDGSTDNTKSIVEKYIDCNENRIKYIYQKNSERCAARNNGISKSNNKWICFLDSDDTYSQNHLEEMNLLINKNNQANGLYFSGLSLGKYDNSSHKYILDFETNLEFILLNNPGVPRACVSKKILLEMPFNESINLGEDTELWTRIVIKYSVFFHYKKTFIEFEHSERASNNKSIKDAIRQTTQIKELITKYGNQISLIIKFKILINCYFNNTKLYIYHGQRFKAIKTIISCVFLNSTGKIISLIFRKKIFFTQGKHYLLILFELLFLKPRKILNEYKN